MSYVLPLTLDDMEVGPAEPGTVESSLPVRNLRRYRRTRALMNFADPLPIDDVLPELAAALACDRYRNQGAAPDRRTGVEVEASPGSEAGVI